MLRRIKSLARSFRERILSLVILPAFFLGTLPHTACICADGHREALCRAGTCRAINSASGATTCCGCSCCKNRSASGTRSCCQAKSCCATKHKTADGIAAKNSCCQPIVEASAPAVAATKTNVESQTHFVAATQFVTTPVGADNSSPAIERCRFSTPPPLDAVIVFH